jgi:hypothetical protein
MHGYESFKAACVICMQDNLGKNTNTQAYLIFIAFPRQQWLSERAPTLRYTHIGCLVTSPCRRFK